MNTTDRLVPADPASAPSTSVPVDMRPLMASFPSGVTVTTALHSDGRPWGMTCTSLCSVSLDPPILLVCLRCGSPTLEAIAASRSFAVNLLHEQARAFAELFASGAVDRFEQVRWSADGDAAGPHLLDAAHTIADCEVVEDSVVGDHAVVLGRVRAVTRLRPQRPLLYGLRRYATWSDSVDGSYLFSDAQAFDWS
ncbi:flavin reductase family protein [Micromonospora narathiwatensis]|uniref:NADH-FMN oxidoreductase RutF, flavin reductase (DIM6/NTAB) family n=1 Tax=Micromonospora narathiwatensis TaxID=299146 RepID=A0A1A8ZHP1_9ACTN|nr:flavin reductase family protein [Micromonospora narathiwatensis]SBT43348.1 NADH-FMN oxidoreductase RutF, flavin reductase (DIM6/NTAB) family [Micromonospora narathiwatensis]